jgi:predicted ATPase
MPDPTFLKRVRIKNYRSIGACDLALGPLTFLVGPNGSGKSNFLDALRFAADSLRDSLDHAIRERGGIGEVRRRSTGHPNNFSMRLDFAFESVDGHYSFHVGSKPSGGYEVLNEECAVSGARAAFYHVRKGLVVRYAGLDGTPPPASSDRLYLPLASGWPVLRPVYEGFSRMGFYNLNPDRIRDLQSPDAAELLRRDGSNLASILGALARKAAGRKDRIEQYLSKVVPGVEKVDVKAMGSKETIEFRQKVAGADHPWRFDAASMSDGTLRALGVLVSLFQFSNGDGPPVRLVGIEEPETALHPAAAGLLLDALLEASEGVQVIVTSHSPDLLDSKELSTESILAVVGTAGQTEIAQVDQTGRDALKEGLYTPGELLRLDQLLPDPNAVAASESQMKLIFEHGD